MQCIHITSGFSYSTPLEDCKLLQLTQMYIAQDTSKIVEYLENAATVYL